MSASHAPAGFPEFARYSIKSNADKIEHEARLSEKGLHKLVENAQKTLRALNVELVNEEEEARTPVRLSSMPPR